MRFCSTSGFPPKSHQTACITLPPARGCTSFVLFFPKKTPFDSECCLSFDILILCGVFLWFLLHRLPNKGVEFPFLFLPLTASLLNFFQWPLSSWDSLFVQQWLSVVITPALVTSYLTGSCSYFNYGSKESMVFPGEQGWFRW